MSDNKNSKQPLVSISVPVFNRAQDIALCLDSLLKLDFPKDDYEIIVVDNNSIDNTKEVIQGYPVRYVFEPKIGRGPARHKGVQESKGKYLAFIDSDCIADPNWLKELVKALDENPHIAAFGGKVTPLKMETRVERYIEARGYFNQEMAVEAFKIGHFPRFITANAIIRHHILTEIGGFDEGLESFIDTELCCRLLLQGFQIGYASEAMVFHRHRSNLRQYFLRRVEIGKAAYIFNKKYEGILYGNILDNKIGFLAGDILALIKMPFELFIRLARKENDYPQKNFIFIEIIGRIYSILGKIGMCIKDIFFQLPTVAKPKNVDKIMSLYRGLFISSNSSYLLRPASGIFWFLSNDLIKFMRISDYSFFALNETSTRIWQVLCETRDFSKTVENISTEYHIDKEIVSQDIQGLLMQLEKERILVKSKTENQ